MKKLVIAALACAAVVALGACKEKSGAEKLGDAVKDTAVQVEKAGDKAASNAADALKSATDSAKQ